MLTAEDYRAISTGLNMPTGAFIDGSFRPAKSSARSASVNPATGTDLERAAACGGRDVDLAVEKARGTW